MGSTLRYALPDSVATSLLSFSLPEAALVTLVTATVKILADGKTKAHELQPGCSGGGAWPFVDAVGIIVAARHASHLLLSSGEGSMCLPVALSCT